MFTKPTKFSDINNKYEFEGWADTAGKVYTTNQTFNTKETVLNNNKVYKGKWKGEPVPPTPTPTSPTGVFNYNIIWDSNGNWQDGRNDTQLITYDHSTNTIQEIRRVM